MSAPIEVVQIISSDGHTFYLDKKCAIVSRVIENMLNTQGTSEILTLWPLSAFVRSKSALKWYKASLLMPN